MSKQPDWMKRAQDNKTGNTVGTASLMLNQRNKPGPKKAKIERKNVGFKISKRRNIDIDRLEIALKLEGLLLTRGRSETIELAVLTVLDLLEQPKEKMLVIDLLKRNLGLEDNQDN